MNRNIKVTSDRENEIKAFLNKIGREKEKNAIIDYGLCEKLYEELFFAPISQNNTLASFYPDGKYIVLNEVLLDYDISRTDVENIFLHELAHALDFAINKKTTGHSIYFREYCSYLGVDKGFEKSRVKANLEGRRKSQDRIKKLMALTASPFENEAMIALSKAQKLMIDTKVEKKDEEKLYIAELYENGRISLYISKIASFISRITGVFIVKCKNDKLFVLTAYGGFDEVEFSIYLFDYLIQSFEKEIRKLRKKGEHISKDAFIAGAIPELEAKISSKNENANALIAIQDENKNKAQRLIFHNGLRTVKYSSRQISRDNYHKGALFAKQLDIPKGINQKKIT